MPHLLTVSNGRGEDYIAARVLEQLRVVAPHVRATSFPLVGTGEQLTASGIEVVGPRREMPSGGFTMHSPAVLWRDLRSGFLDLTSSQASFLRRQRPDAVLVVGDFYAQAQAALVPAPRRVMQTLVSVHHGGGRPGLLRYFMEGFRPPELWLMRRAEKVYARDAATAAYLRLVGVDAACLGNPMMDGLDDAPVVTGAPEGVPVVALLPGSRGQAEASVALMRRALELLPRAHGLVAWTGAAVPDLPDGWTEEAVDERGVVAAWRRGQTRVWWVRDRFAAVLRSSLAVVGTAGTASEQAVGLGLPVVAFPVPPFYGEAYMRNQKRLLEGGLLTTTAEPGRVAAMLNLALSDGPTRERARTAGLERMGAAGAAAAVAGDLVAWLDSSRRG